MLYALSNPLPPRITAGWPAMCVFVIDDEGQRYLATSIVVAAWPTGLNWHSNA